MNTNEPTMIGLSEKTHSLLTQMKEDGHLAEMADGYRLGIALSLAKGVIPPEVPTPRKTVFSVATIDPDHDLATAIRSIANLECGSVYRMAERLAEFGINEINAMFEGGAIDISEIIRSSNLSPSNI